MHDATPMHSMLEYMSMAQFVRLLCPTCHFIAYSIPTAQLDCAPVGQALVFNIILCRAVAFPQAIRSELDALRSNLDKESASISTADARVTGLSARLLSLQKQLSQQDQEIERLQTALAAAEDAAKSARAREEAARAQGREFAERSRRAETLYEESEAEVAQVWPAVGVPCRVPHMCRSDTTMLLI